MRIVQRDLDILDFISKFGCLTTMQIAELFNLNIKVCQRRLRKIAENDYIRNIPIPSVKTGRCPYLWYLGSRGADFFNVPVSKPRLTISLSHQINNSSILIKILNSLDSDIRCEIMPEHLIRTAQQEIIPDAAFMLKKNEKRALFLLENFSGRTEIIRSHALNEDIENKIIRYVELFVNNEVGFYEKYFGCSFNRFRLLFLVANHVRLNSISSIVEEHDDYGFNWISQLKELYQKGILAKIWYVPKHKSIFSIA